MLDGREPWWVEAGDCLAVLPLLPDGCVDAVVCDPPYGIGFDFGKRRPRRAAVRKPLSWGTDDPDAGHRGWRNVAGDDRPFDPLPLLRFPRVVLWGANHYADKLPASGCWLVWDKKCDTAPDSFSDCELAWTNLPGTVRKFAHLWRGVVRAGEENVANGAKLHPAQKPVDLMCWCIERLKLPPGSLILDPYCGSGTTGVAARRMGHRFIGVELSPEYADIARRRIAAACHRAAADAGPGQPDLFGGLTR